MTNCSTAVLLIDAGNTRVKFAHYDALRRAADNQGSGWDAKVNKFILTHDELGDLAAQLAAFENKPKLVIGVNVAGPAVQAKIMEQIDLHCGVANYEYHWLTSQPQLLHLKNSYVDHRQLGSDRWLAVLGVSVHKYAAQRPVMLISFGTATTVDTVFENTFLGGLIFPGLQLMADSVAQRTAQLPAINWEKSTLPVKFPSSTAEALESGMIGAQTAAVLRQWSLVIERCQQQPVVFYAGGAADYVVPELSRLLTEQAKLHGFDTIDLFPFDDPALAGLLVYAQHCLEQK